MSANAIAERTDDLVQQARTLHAERKFNCAQAVAYVLAEEVGADPEAMYVLSEGFGAGMGATTETCGAISGAIFALSQLNSAGTAASGTTKAATYRLVRELVNGFREMNGTTICRELKGVGSPDGVRRSCEGCIEDAVRLAAGIIARA